MYNRADINLPPVRAAYGVDLADGFAAVVRVHAVRGGIHKETLLDERGDDLKSALTQSAQRVLADVMFRKAILSAALPVQDSMARWLEAPFPSMAKARKVLPSLLDIQLPFPLESCVHGFPLLEATDTGRVRALAVAARKENIQSRLAACAEMNMDPHCLDHEGLALWTQSLAEQPAMEGLRAVVYLGVDRTVWVFGEGSRFLSAHASRIGVRELGSADAQGAAATEWRDRVARMLRAQFPTETEITMHWWWTGPGADDNELRRKLESLLHVVDAGIRFDAHPQPATFLATALASRALKQNHIAWNYRLGDSAHPAVAQWRDSTLRKTAWTVLAAGLVLCALNLSFGTLTDLQSRRADRALEQLAKSITGLPLIPRGQESVVVQRAIEEQRDRLAPFLRAFEPSRTEQVRNLLQWGQAGGMQFESVTLRADQLLIQGTADDWDGCEVLARHLRDAGWTVNLDRQEAVAVEHIQFRLTAGRDS